jgi:site-specific DNA-methyltransferase (adenine-specific)
MVVDPFGGTGTTALAAEQLGRRWLVTELNPRYAAVVPSRFVAGR